MEKKHHNPTHGRMPFLCMFCGEYHFRLIADIDKAVKNPVKCKKCGREARVFTLGGYWAIFQDLFKEQEKMRMRIYELECAEQERAEPGVVTAEG